MKSTFYHEAETKEKLIEFIRTAKQLGMGPVCERYEAAFAKKQQRTYAVAMASGSAANLVLIQACLNLGLLRPGDGVGVSALTWATNVMPIIQLGLKPIVIDCELSSLNVSLATLQAAISVEMKALFITNVLGFSHDIDQIRDYCTAQGIIFLEDNCESLGSKVNGKLLGNFGLASTFSTYVGHHLSTIEGGMICTDDEALYKMLLMVRSHGWDRHLPAAARQEIRNQFQVDEFYGRYTFYDLAFNARPTEITGLLGLAQLEYWDEIVAKREQNFYAYDEAISGNTAFISLDTTHMDLVSNFAMPVVCRDPDIYLEYRSKFTKSGVEIRPIIAGDITQQPFFKKYSAGIRPCPNAALIHAQGFYFPNHPELTGEEISQLCSLLV